MDLVVLSEIRFMNVDADGVLNEMQIKGGYAKASRADIVPLGPVPDMMPKGSAK